jgi:MFS family permease
VAESRQTDAYAETYDGGVLPTAPQAALRELPLLEQFRFFRLALSTLVTSVGSNALAYTLLIVVIDETESGIFASIFVLCSLLPVIIFSLFAGIVVDHLPNKLVLVVANMARFVGITLLLLYAPTNVSAILLFVVFFWSVREFSAPAATSVLPAILPRHRYSTGAALVDVASLIGQLVGMVLLAPIVLKVAGPEPIYAVAAVLYAVAAYLVLSIPGLTDPRVKKIELQDDERRLQLRDALSAGWRMLRSDRIALQAMVEYTLLGTATAILVVLAPDYTEEVVNTSAENLVFIFSPAAAGLFIGIWLAPILGRAVGNPAAATAGFVVFVLAIAGFAFSGVLDTIVKENGFVPIEEIADFFNIGFAVVITMLLALPAGMGAGVVGIAAKATLLERAPAEGRGRIFATQSWASGVLSLIPIFVAGLIAATVDVRIAIFLLAVGMAIVALYVRFGLTHEPEVPAPISA